MKTLHISNVPPGVLVYVDGVVALMGTVNNFGFNAVARGEFGDSILLAVASISDPMLALCDTVWVGVDWRIPGDSMHHMPLPDTLRIAAELAAPTLPTPLHLVKRVIQL